MLILFAQRNQNSEYNPALSDRKKATSPLHSAGALLLLMCPLGVECLTFRHSLAGIRCAAWRRHPYWCP